MRKITKPMSCAAAIAVSMAVALASPSMAYASDLPEDTTPISSVDNTETTDSSNASDDQSDASTSNESSTPANPPAQEDNTSSTPPSSQEEERTTSQSVAFAPLNVPAPDTTKPAITIAPVPTVIGGTYTFGITQNEDNPQKAYVEWDVMVNGKWQKLGGTWLGATNVLDLTLDTVGLPELTRMQIKVSSWDQANNNSSATHEFLVDNTAPKMTLKASSVIVNDHAKRPSWSVSDNDKIDGFYVNGTFNNLTDSKYSDIPPLRVGWYGAVEGWNDVYVVDRAGNPSAVVHVYLDETGPVLSVKTEMSTGSDGVYKNVSIKAHDPSKVDAFIVNGQTIDRSNNEWTDLNNVTVGSFGLDEGPITIGAVDIFGNYSEISITLDVTTPVLTLPSGVVVGPNPYTFQVSQVEVNPGRTYVEIQQMVNGKWQKFAGQEFKDTNTFDFTVDADALGLQHGVQTQLKVSTWDDAGNHTSATSAVAVDLVGPQITWQLQPDALYGIGDGFHVRPITNEVGTLKAVYIDSVAPENLVWSLDSAHKNFDTKNTSNQALWDSLTDGQHAFIAVFTDAVGNSTTSTSNTFAIDRTSPEVTNESQVWQDKDGGRASVTLTFSEPVSGLGQGWYGSGTTWTKAYYNTKPTTVTFVDAAGNPGSYVVTPMAEPMEETEPQPGDNQGSGGNGDDEGTGGDTNTSGEQAASVSSTPLTPAQLADTGADGNGPLGAIAAAFAAIIAGLIARLKRIFS